MQISSSGVSVPSLSSKQGRFFIGKPICLIVREETCVVWGRGQKRAVRRVDALPSQPMHRWGRQTASQHDHIRLSPSHNLPRTNKSASRHRISETEATLQLQQQDGNMRWQAPVRRESCGKDAHGSRQRIHGLRDGLGLGHSPDLPRAPLLPPCRGHCAVPWRRRQ